jgi:glutathione-regulated potassium-efflux system protein KefB
VALGVSVEDAAEVVLDVRRRDAERLQLELAGGLSAGRELMRQCTETHAADHAES